MYRNLCHAFHILNSYRSMIYMIKLALIHFYKHLFVYLGLRTAEATSRSPRRKLQRVWALSSFKATMLCCVLIGKVEMGSFI